MGSYLGLWTFTSGFRRFCAVDFSPWSFECPAQGYVVKAACVCGNRDERRSHVQVFRRSTSELSDGYLFHPSHDAGCVTRTPFGATDSNWVRQQAAGQPITPTGRRVFLLMQNPWNQYRKLVPRGNRTIQFENATSYVLMEPGEDEQFLTLEELQSRLKSWLVKWPGKELPEDLRRYESLDEVVNYLVESGCELDLGGGLGSLQWYEVRLES